MNNVFFSYTDGYPEVYTAANTKASFLAKGFLELGHNVLFINKINGRNNLAPSHGSAENIEYVSIKEGNVFHRVICSFEILKRAKYPDGLNILYVGCGHFFILLPIMIYAKLLGYKVSFIFEEWMPSMKLRLPYKINAYLHGYFLGYFSDVVMPISEFLMHKSRRFHKPQFKLPICADFLCSSKCVSQFVHEKYFLYCASSDYCEMIKFAIDSFEIAFQKNHDVKLKLVLSGDVNFFNNINTHIQDKGMQECVTIYSRLPYDQLCGLYNGAQGLLIPLDFERVSDKARFSQKIAEYLSTKRPILTTAVGEINLYFRDGENALICKTKRIEEFSSLYRFVIENPEKADIIGKNGYKLGLQKFDYRVLASGVCNFMK